jgi:hypothetical protein
MRRSSVSELPRAQTLEQVEALLPTAIEPDALIAAVKDAVR